MPQRAVGVARGGRFLHSLPIVMPLRFRARSLLLIALAGSVEVGCESTSGLTGGTSVPDAGSKSRPEAGLEAGLRDFDAGPEASVAEGGPADSQDGSRDATLDAAAPLPGTAAVAVASPRQVLTFCVVTQAGDVECWGDNEFGQVGDGTTTFRSAPTKVKGLSGPASQVVVGAAYVCALLRSGSVDCWGYGADGELGDGTMSDHSATPVAVSGLHENVVALSAGYLTTCAVEQDGTVWCWGIGALDVLGSGSTANAVVPTKVSGIDDGATAVSVGFNFGCAIRHGGVVCWGADDGLGELGNGTNSGSPTPVAVTGLSAGMQSIAAGDTFACALSQAGDVSCWGFGTGGELGEGSPASSTTPVAVVGLTHDVRAIAAGDDSACAVEADGTAWCWGLNAIGELGADIEQFKDGNLYTAVPVAVKGLTGKVAALSIGAAPCAALANGALECWGLTAEQALIPVAVEGYGSADEAAHVSVGGNENLQGFACATDTRGALACWGANRDGQLGDSMNAPSTLPVENLDFTMNVTSVSAGNEGDFACAVTSGSVYCWGDNPYGQLGDDSTTSSNRYVPVVGLTDAVAVSAGTATACALTTGGAVYCWGGNSFGELGNDSTKSSKLPVPVKGLASGVTAISVGVDFACALLSDQTVDCWGSNEQGELGTGTNDNSLVPVAVPMLSGVVAIGTGDGAACAATSTGVFCWGTNQEYQLGNGTGVDSNVPVAVSGIGAGATQVAVGSQNACAVVNGGALCWGVPIALGNGNGFYLAPGAVPVVGLDEGVTDLSVGSNSACAVAKGELKCWGFNYSGQLGNGGAVDAIVATPVAGFP